MDHDLHSYKILKEPQHITAVYDLLQCMSYTCTVTDLFIAQVVSVCVLSLKATGISLGTTLQTLAGFLCAVVISFEASWLLSIVLFFCFPMLATVGYFQIKFQQGRSAKNKLLMEESGRTSVEAIDQIRTVSSLGMQAKLAERYDECLKPPFK